jgi:hypothetical protein
MLTVIREVPIIQISNKYDLNGRNTYWLAYELDLSVLSLEKIEDWSECGGNQLHPLLNIFTKHRLGDIASSTGKGMGPSRLLFLKRENREWSIGNWSIGDGGREFRRLG